MSLDNLEIGGVRRTGHQSLGVFHVLGENLHLLGLDGALLSAGVVEHQGVAHFASSLQHGVLPSVEGLLVLHLGHFQAGNDLPVLEDGLYKASHSRKQYLTRVHQSVVVGEGTGAGDGDVGVEAAACSIHVVEALSQLHLGSVHIGTVLQQLNAYARAVLLGQRLLVELSAGNGLGGLAHEQRERVLHFTNLALHVHHLGLYGEVARLGTLHSRRAIADTRLLHHFHLLPCVFRECRHVVEDFQLAVKQQQRVVEVGHVRNNVGLHNGLVVFRAQQLHLSAALSVQQ